MESRVSMPHHIKSLFPSKYRVKMIHEGWARNIFCSERAPCWPFLQTGNVDCSVTAPYLLTDSSFWAAIILHSWSGFRSSNHCSSGCCDGGLAQEPRSLWAATYYDCFSSGLPLSCQIRWGTGPSLFPVVPQPREYLDAFIFTASHSHFVVRMLL